ncbi:MAG: prepilin-type N-terminal cleavage/methylation domain-containing protein [Candidatus Omnitrophica bacterium]|nr:prepilin-type N-terminal cleavage/methylation domain-containing protein [Candidatus Omnitrophota bacterium]
MKEKKGFTLLELIVVIIIVGILATVGLATYTNQIEYSRTAEVRAKASTMRKLAYEYYLKNGTLDGIRSSDVGGQSCSSTTYYEYSLWTRTSSCVLFGGFRCSSGGKTPQAPVRYYYYMEYHPNTGKANWYCYYSGDKNTGCFGLSPYGECN